MVSGLLLSLRVGSRFCPWHCLLAFCPTFQSWSATMNEKPDLHSYSRVRQSLFFRSCMIPKSHHFAHFGRIRTTPLEDNSLGTTPRRTTPPEDDSPGGRLPRRTTPPQDNSPGGNNNRLIMIIQDIYPPGELSGVSRPGGVVLEPILETKTTQHCCIMLQSHLYVKLSRKTARPLGRGQDAESYFVNPHSFRNLSAYSWKIPLTVFIPSGLIPRTQYKGNNDSYTCPRTECRNDNLLPQPFLVLSAL